MAGPFKMKNSGLKMSAKSGSPMQANYASPTKKDEKPRGSDQEKEIVDGRDYVGDDGVVKTAAMERLERNKPDSNSANYASWQTAYDKAKARQTAENTKTE